MLGLGYHRRLVLGGIGAQAAAELVEQVIGDTASGAASSLHSFDADTVFAQRYPVPAGEVRWIGAYLPGNGAAVNFRGALYAEDGGEPGALLGQTADLFLAAGHVAGWHEFELASPVTVASGSVWVGWQCDVDKWSNVDTSGTAATAKRFVSAPYASGLPDPYGTGTGYSNTRSMRLGIYV